MSAPLSIADFDPRSPTQRWSGYQPGQGESEIPRDGLGRRWYVPDEAARKRLKCYLDAERLLDVDEHHPLFVELGTPSPPDEEQWIPVDFPGTLSRLVRHYVLGPDFAVSAESASGEARVQEIAERSSLPLLLRQAGEALPAFGDAVLRVDVEDVEEDDETRPRAVVKFIHPGHYFPRISPLDATRVDEVTLAWVVEKSEPGAAESEWPYVLLREVHKPGQVTYEANDWNGKEVGRARGVDEYFPDLEDGATGIDEIPIVHVGFNVAGGQHFGRSTFKRIKRIFLALENRLSQEDEILERHARPKLIVGPGILGPEGRANMQDFDVIEIEPGILEKGVKPEYLTWDPQIDAIKHQLGKLEEYFFMTTETSPSSFGLERDGSQVESARALRFKAHRTVNMVEDLRDGLGPAIKRILTIAQKMESAALVEDGLPGYSPARVKVYFPDPVIEDESQEVEDYSTMKGAGLVSRMRAVRDLHGLTEKEAEAEVREILQDMTDELAATPTAAPAGIEGNVAAGEPVPTGTTPAAQA